jgi:hypothetical protein
MFDVPVFKSLPSKFENKNKEDKDYKLNKISITDIYKDEPFDNNKKYLNILFILIILFIFFNLCFNTNPLT